MSNNQDEEEFYAGIEKDKNPNKNLSEATRKYHRLETARCTIYIGLAILLILSLTPQILHLIPTFDGDKVNEEIIRDGITTIATIITLALGFIAGSNID